MSGLPPGWEWDYDGTRWFYRYKPNGHIQFHFPKEGDEFPDFIDALSPAPELAPEEKLESQQQLKRRTIIDGDPKSKMRATGGPLTDFGMSRSGFGGPAAKDGDDVDGDTFFFQPENFMYLGPGAYADISPLVDEDERDDAPKDRRKTKSDEPKDKMKLDAASEKTGVSPLQSEANTPSVVNSLPVREAVAMPRPMAEELPSEPVLVINTQDTPGGANQGAVASPGVPLLDSIEKPRQEPTPAQTPPWDPVGIMAEMATEHTAAAHIEIHPDPVEMADNAVLAPIETRTVDLGIAELPERTSPSEQKPPGPSSYDLLHQTTMTDSAIHGATFGTGSRPQSSSPTQSAVGTPETHPGAVAQKPPVNNPAAEPAAEQPRISSPAPNDGSFNIKRKPSKTGAKQPKYQPYTPGAVPSVASGQQCDQRNREPDFKRPEHRNTLARDASLMIGTRQKFESSSVPFVLQPPQVPPKQPLEPSTQQPASSAMPEALHTPEREPANATANGVQTSGLQIEASLQHVPSVLKPARGRPQQQAATENAAARGRNSPQRHATHPSVPGNPSKAPVQYSAFQPGRPVTQEAQPFRGANLHTMPQPGQIPHSFTPAPCQQPGPRPGVQRVEAAPAQPPVAYKPLQRVALLASSSTPAIPQLQRLQGESDGYQSFAQRAKINSPPTSNRARSSSDAPQVLRTPPVVGQQSVTTTETFDMPEPPTTTPNAPARPRSATDSIKPHSPASTNRSVQSPPSDPERPRQLSYASSEVSSIGPPTGSQSSGLPLQTPSPLESTGRRPSSGFFRGANGSPYPPGSEGSPMNQVESPFAGQGIPLRPAGTRPAFFSGPSPTSAQPTTTFPVALSVGQSPPAVPGKVPIQQSVGNAQYPSMMPGNRTVQNLRGQAPPQSPEPNRRHSLPTEQLAALVSQPLPGQLQPRQVGLAGSSHAQQQSQQGHGKPMQHPPQPIPSQPGQPLGGLPPGGPHNGPQPLQVNHNATKQPSTGRPQRPTVTPPSQQFSGPMSPGTPIRTPGHLLQPIQEHTEGDHAKGVPAAAPRSSQDVRRHSPGSSRSFSPGSSVYPSSAESPSTQNLGKLTSPTGQHPVMPQHNLPSQSQLMSPMGPNAGQTYSPVQNNPFQQSPTNFVAQSPQNVMRPGSTPPVLQQVTKEKGGWLSKLMKGSAKPSVLQKPPPPQHAPPGQPSPGVNIANANWNGAQPASPIVANQPIPVTFQQIRPLVPELATALGTQSMPTSPIQSLPHQPFGGQDPQVQQNQAAVASFQQPSIASVAQAPVNSPPQAPPHPQVHQPQKPARQMEQAPANALPRGLAPASVPHRDQMVDNMSDAASVSTMDVSEAQAQPVLKPQLVTVENAAHPPPQQQLPSRVAMSQGVEPRPPPPKQGFDSRASTDTDLAVAPLFSKAQTKTTVSTVSVSQVPAVNEKWAKKAPALDYSGDDWPDDPWDYQ